MTNLLITYFILINIVGFFIMFIDKKKAINHSFRISERNLIFIALIGGSIGTLLSMKAFRHKTKHIKFTLGIPLILTIQIAVFLYIMLK